MSVTANVAAEPNWALLRRWALLAALAGLLACAVGALLSPAHFFRSYLVGYQFWLGVGLGCLVILMLHHLTGGTWGRVLRPLLEAGTHTLVLLAILFVPVALGMGYLYHWAHHPGHNSWYLNVPFFLARAVLYFAIWLTVAFLLNRWSAGRVSERRFQLLSAPGLVLYGLTITFAAIDWSMSLEPHWYSSIYPVLYASGQVLAGLAFAVVLWLLLVPGLQERDRAAVAPLRDLGNLLLAFVMMWAYVSISQFLIIWSGNLPEENIWYLRRTRDGWQYLAMALAVLHFGLPFLLLLSRDVKESPRALTAVALLILLMRFLDVLWWVEPAFDEGLHFYWLLDVAALVGLGGVWMWWFLGQVQRRPLPPLDGAGLEGAGHD
jgi:hypothetical protein